MKKLFITNHHDKISGNLTNPYLRLRQLLPKISFTMQPELLNNLIGRIVDNHRLALGIGPPDIYRR